MTVGEQFEVEIGVWSGKRRERKENGEKQFLIRRPEVTNDEVED